MEEWESFEKSSSDDSVFKLLSIVNEKFREALPIFEFITTESEKFQDFFERVVLLHFGSDIFKSGEFSTQYVTFLINLYKSLEDPIIRKCGLRAFSLPLWRKLSSSRLQRELDSNPSIRRHWEFLNTKKEDELPVANLDAELKEKSGSKKSGRKRKTPDASTTTTKKVDAISRVIVDWETEWIPSLLKGFISNIEKSAEFDSNTLRYLERFTEFMIDILSQLPTRRFFFALFDDMHILVRIHRSLLYSLPEASLFRQLVEMLASYVHFEVDNHTGQALTQQEILAQQNDDLHRIQRHAFTDHSTLLKDLIFSSTGELGKSGVLARHLIVLSDTQLAEFVFKLGYISKPEYDFMMPGNNNSTEQDASYSYVNREFILDVLEDTVGYRQSQLELASQIPLIPSESLLWNENMIPKGAKYTGEQVLALPKLNLQFLTMHDYLLRNFTLFRLESAYEIREDLVDAVKRMGPRSGLGGQVVFGGWARMALPIISFTVDEVAKPNLGERVPSHVNASIEVDLSRFNGEIRSEWEALKQHDVIFLLCIRNPQVDVNMVLKSFEKERSVLSKGKKVGRRRDFQWSEEDLDFPQRYGVQYVRGGEIFEIRDEQNVILNDPTKPDERKSGRIGNKRKIRIRLDAAQYYADLKAGLEVYEGLNLLVRRRPKENNFRAVLDTIRDIMNMAAVGRAVPMWLHDVFLGYGNPASANFRMLEKSLKEDLDYYDTFLDAQHVKESFPGAEVVFEDLASSVITGDSTSLPSPPYRLKIERKSETNGLSDDKVTVTPYRSISMGPYPTDQRPRNTVRFTPIQVEAIRSGLNPGLTMVVGPPGTGKTDVATQIIAGLYRNDPDHKILVVAHSNAALNDLFDKIMQRNVDPRHLLRLGSGESDLREILSRNAAVGEGEEFSKQGRVNWSLARRIQLLEQVQRLAVSIGISGDVGYTCETASYFQLEHIQSRLEKFEIELSKIVSAGEEKQKELHCIQKIFPFNLYFIDALQPLFSGISFQEDLEVARGCFRHINKLFEELSDYRAFELLRTQSHRGDYLLTKQARIVAMTCTHAAMTRRRLVELGFKYDSLIMEEAAQILEVETLIPMLLQDVDIVDGCRLKRVVLIGDHYQLPPVVKHTAFQKYSRFDQSLFTRLVRVGVPTVLLDKQGRARPEITALYSWRYKGPNRSLGDLPNVLEGEYQNANTGLLHTYQLIDVPEFKERGEFCPTPFFYQNLGEAEYIVAVYQYMRLLGYPSSKISILATYNGQKHLIRDVLQQRCRHPLFGMPAAVSTVDKYQGQQNDYILLSLVRTESVGHLRDIRRLVVAASRARLGLYIFCRAELFRDCFELKQTFSLLDQRPSKLVLVKGEGYPTQRKSSEPQENLNTHTVDNVTDMGVLVYQMVQIIQQQQQDSLRQQLQANLVSSTPFVGENIEKNDDVETTDETDPSAMEQDEGVQEQEDDSNA